MASDLQGELITNEAGRVYEFPYMKPEDLGWVENWKREIWNPRTRQFFGRTGKSWGEFIYYKLVSLQYKNVHVISYKLCRVTE